ncbi:MAG: ribosome-binding factor A [Magnetococcus sp. WYHC-3]
MAFIRERYLEKVSHAAAAFIERESNRTSLITVTGIGGSKSLTHVKILISVIPESEEENVLGFLRRNVNSFKTYLKKDAKISRVPFVEFVSDKGEKNRLALENISKEV